MKVVKWCGKKWNEHNLMYIYHKQCDIMQNFNETAQTANFTVSHWFPVEMVHIGPKLRKCTSGWPGTHYFKGDANFNMFPQKYRKITLKWAIGTSGSFKIVRTPAFYIISRSGQGKWVKTYFFSHFGQLLQLCQTTSYTFQSPPYLACGRPLGHGGNTIAEYSDD